MTLDHLLTLGIPTRQLSIDTTRRIRLTVAATGMILLMGGAVAVFHLLHGRLETAVGVTVLLVAGGANLCLLRRTRQPETSGHFAVGLVYGVLLLTGTSEETFGAPSVTWMPTLPLAAFLLCGVGRGWIWTITSGALITLFWLAHPGTPVSALGNRLALLVATAGFASAFVGVQRKAERDFMQATAALEGEVRERRRAEQEAREATRAKSEFLASMSHEIRTPMVGITGMTDLLLADALTRSQREWAKIIRRSADTLLGLINDVLDFSRIEARHLSLDQIGFDLQTVAEDVAELLAPVARERGLDLAVTCEGIPPMLLGDPHRVRQVLTNLVGNAAKFTESGWVLVVLCPDPSDPDAVRIEVRDTGIGIASDRLGHVFEPFTQADSSTARRFGGTGLGLAISKRLVELMGGRIGVTSKPARGSTFWFTLPARAPEPTPLPAMARVSGIRVAAVSDRPATLRSMTESLSRIGADVVLATANVHDLVRLNGDARELDVVLLDGRTAPPAAVDAGDSLRLLVFEAPGITSAVPNDARVEPLAWPIREQALAEAVTGVRTLVLDAESFDRVPDGGRILLVEDNEVNQMVLRSMIEQCGCTVDVAGGGREAIRRIQDGRYDLVLLDCHMPDLDGYATVRAIRGLGLDAIRLPVVALTASVLPDEPERCRAAGMNDYLSKPVGQAQLASTLCRYLATRPQPEPSRGTASDASESNDDDGAHTPPVFDQHGTLARLGGRAAILLRVIRLYQRDAAEILERLQTGVSTGDLDTVTSVAHSLKGSLGSLGGHAARESVAQLEATAKSGDAGALPQAMTVVETELRRLDVALLEAIDALA